MRFTEQLWKSLRGSKRPSAAANHADTFPSPAGNYRTPLDSVNTGVQLEPGDIVAEFQVLAHLGAGGMGSVYKCRNLKLDRIVALKVLLFRGHGSIDHKSIRRLEKEARTLARLHNVNVVNVYSATGFDDTDMPPAIEMEYVAGQNLRAWMAPPDPRDRPSTEQILSAFLQAGRGLEAAHAKGIIHRDFKPENVFIDEEGGVKVGDFGIASTEHDATVDRGASNIATSSAGTGQTTNLHGTWQYLAPELHGENEDATADERSDQFSFCVSLQEALFGAHPFDANHFDIREAKYRAPEGPRVAELPSVVKLVRKGCRHNPLRRHTSMRRVNAILERALEDVRDQSRRVARRNWAIAGGVTLILGLGGAGVTGKIYKDRFAFKEVCLEAARNDYAKGTFAALNEAHERLVNCEVGPRRRISAGAKLVHADAELLYAGLPEAKFALEHRRWPSADALVARVVARTLELRRRAGVLELREYEQLWSSVEAERESLLAELDRARDKSHELSVAPNNSLWVKALLLSISQLDPGRRAALVTELELGIRSSRSLNHGRPQYLLVHYRSELEEDDARAAELLAGYLDEPWAEREGADELRSMLAAKRAYRVALEGLAGGGRADIEGIEAALVLDGEAIQSSARLADAELRVARLVVDVLSEEEPERLRAELDPVLASAEKMWWNQRLVDTALTLEDIVGEREAEAEFEELERQLQADFIAGELSPDEAVQRARILQRQRPSEVSLPWLVARARVQQTKTNHSPKAVLEAVEALEQVLDDERLGVEAREQALTSLEELRELGDEVIEEEAEPPTRVKVTLRASVPGKGVGDAAEFWIRGQRELLSATPAAELILDSGAHRMRCRGRDPGWGPEKTIVVRRRPTTFVCTKSGVERYR